MYRELCPVFGCVGLRGFARVARVCAGLRGFARVCAGLRGFARVARVCAGLRGFARVCGVRGFARVCAGCAGLRGFARVCAGSRGFARVCAGLRGLRGFARVCAGSRGFARVCAGLRGSARVARVCAGLRGFARVCARSPGFVRFRLGSRWFVRVWWWWVNDHSNRFRLMSYRQLQRRRSAKLSLMPKNSHYPQEPEQNHSRSISSWCFGTFWLAGNTIPPWVLRAEAILPTESFPSPIHQWLIIEKVKHGFEEAHLVANNWNGWVLAKLLPLSPVSPCASI